MSPKSKENKRQKAQLQPKKQVQKVVSISSNKWIWVALAVVIITTFIIYFRAIKFNILYSWDDSLYIRENSHIKDLKWENIKLFFTNFYVAHYQPITILSYAIENKLGGGKAFLFHFDNILLHLFNTCLVYVLIRRISPKSAAVALITAAFFAVHPLHVESVVWIAERKDVLYSFFFLLALIMYSSYLKTEKIKHLIFAGIFYVLSCLSKSAAVILPLVMLLMDYYAGRKISVKMFLEKVPFFLISLVFGIVAMLATKKALIPAPDMSIVEHLSIVSFSFFSYLFKAFIPVCLSPIYPYPEDIGSGLPIMYYLSFLFVLAILVFVWYSRKWGRDIIFGFVFFIITIMLVLQFIPTGLAIMADRYSYIPYIGIFFIIGKVYERLALMVNVKLNYQRYLLIFFLFGFISYSALAYERVGIWENEDTLFSDVISQYPHCKLALGGRAMYFMNYHSNYAHDKITKEEGYKKAIADFENSLKYTTDIKEKALVYYDIGVAKNSLGDTAAAKLEYDKSLEVDPSYRDSYLNRGICYMNYYAKIVYARDNEKQMAAINNSIKDFDKAIILDNNFLDAYVNRGNAKIMLKNDTGAIKDFDKAIALNQKDKNALVYINRGIAKNDLKEYESAIKDFDLAIAINANYPDAYTNRGCAKFYLKDYQGALKDYNKVIELTPQDANAVKNRDVVNAILGIAKK